MNFNVAIYSFTNKGQNLAKIIQEKNMIFRKMNVVFKMKDCFAPADVENFEGLIFIGAMGIAVRKIAPFIKDKMTDPAVIVIDENACNVIPVLSGHIGGGNLFAKMLAEELNANVCITTATDVNELPAIDEIAANNNFECTNRDGIVKINKRVLNGEIVSICADDSVKIININEHFCFVKYDENRERCADIIISNNVTDVKRCDLHIFNKNCVLGVGCRKDIDSDLFEKTILNAIDGRVLVSDILQIASIDLKKDEKAILSFSEKYNIPFITYSSSELSKMNGDFEYSKFVLDTTGVSNVSERAAAYDETGDINGTFLIKQIKDAGITVSLFKKNRRFDFNG